MLILHADELHRRNLEELDLVEGAMLVDKRREVLRLYREILRTSRQFQWTNEQGEQWSTLLRKNVRMEMEQNRHEQNSESIAKMIILGWKALGEVQQKLTAKHAEIQKNVQQQQQQQKPTRDK